MDKVTRLYNFFQTAYQGVSDAIENRSPAPHTEPLLPGRQPAAEATESAETRVSIADAPDSPRISESAASPRSSASHSPVESGNDIEMATGGADNDVVRDDASTNNTAGAATNSSITRRRALAYVALTGGGGGVVHGIDAYLANTQAGEATAKHLRDALSLFTQVLGSSTVAVAKSLSPYVMPNSWVHAGEIWSYRLPNYWGAMTGVPQTAREFFRDWTPGTTWPSECARPLGPSRPLPAWCPDLGLASVQRSLLPLTVSSNYAMWGALAGAALGAVVLFTPLGKSTRQAVPEWAWNRARIVVPATVGILPLLPFELSSLT